jgi:ABC-type Na+ transport system ATPase subunit NatA
MKSTTKILESLLKGDTINCKVMLNQLGYSNASREIRRKIEIPFEIQLNRKRMTEKNRYNEVVCFFNYSLKEIDRTKVSGIIKDLKKSENSSNFSKLLSFING